MAPVRPARGQIRREYGGDQLLRAGRVREKEIIADPLEGEELVTEVICQMGEVRR